MMITNTTVLPYYGIRAHMPSDASALESVLKALPDITYRKMMGEYLLYKDGKLFGGIYDNRLLLKITKASARIEEWPSAFPYDGGTEMVMVPEPYDPVLLNDVVNEMLKVLPKARSKP